MRSGRFRLGGVWPGRQLDYGRACTLNGEPAEDGFSSWQMRVAIIVCKLFVRS
jgi:hypothetical protein